MRPDMQPRKHMRRGAFDWKPLCGATLMYMGQKVVHADADADCESCARHAAKVRHYSPYRNQHATLCGLSSASPEASGQVFTIRADRITCEGCRAAMTPDERGDNPPSF